MAPPAEPPVASMELLDPLWRERVRLIDGIPCCFEDWEAHTAWLAAMKQAKRNWYDSDQASALQGPYRHHYFKRVRYLRGLFARLRIEGVPLQRWADVGCGDGTDLWWLREETPALVATDYHPDRLGKALRRAAELGIELSPYATDLRQLPFRSGAFDVIYMNHVLEHIPEDATVLGEVWRVTAPGGVLVLGVPNEGAWWWQLAYTLSPGSRQETDHVHFYTASRIRQRCEAAGFSVSEVVHLGWGIPQWRLDELVRGIKFMDDLFEWVGRRLCPHQASSLYVVARKPAGRPRERAV